LRKLGKMFIFPAASSLLIDILLVGGYLSLEEGEQDLYDFIVVCLAVVRILLLVPLGWHYSKSQKFHYVTPVHRFEILVLVVLVVRAVFLYGRDGLNLGIYDTELTLGSILATLFHYSAVGHMKSSVEVYDVKTKHIFLRMDKTRHGLVTSTHQARPYSSSMISLEDVEEGTVQSNIGIRKGELRSKWKELLKNANNQLSSFMQGTGGRQDLASPFYLFLRLFAYHDVMEEIDAGFDRDPEGFEFYIMQLVMFLLYRSFMDCDRLEGLILNRCGLSIHFGHQVFWVLRAFGEEGANIDIEGQDAIRNSLKEVCVAGETPGLYLSQGQGPGEGLEGVRFPLERFTFHSQPAPQPFSSQLPTTENDPDHDYGPRQYSLETTDTFDEGLSTIESVGNPNVVSPRQSDLDTSHESLSLSRQNTFITKNSSTIRPQDNSFDSDEDSDKASHSTNMSTMDSIINLLGSLNSELPPPEAYNYPPKCFYFTAELQFIDNLVNIASGLGSLPKQERDRALKRQLRALNKDCLPSRLLYLPIGNRRHRIYKIHTSESFSFSTKERVPILVCCEVLDYSKLAQGAAEAHAAQFWSHEKGPLLTPLKAYGRTPDSRNFQMPDPRQKGTRWWARSRPRSMSFGSKGTRYGTETPPNMYKNQQSPSLWAQEKQLLLDSVAKKSHWFGQKKQMVLRPGPGMVDYGTGSPTPVITVSAPQDRNRIIVREIPSITPASSSVDDQSSLASLRMDLEELSEASVVSPRPDIRPDPVTFVPLQGRKTLRREDQRGSTKLKELMGQWYSSPSPDDPQNTPPRHSREHAPIMKKIGLDIFSKFTGGNEALDLGPDVESIDSEDEEKKTETDNLTERSSLAEILGSSKPQGKNDQRLPVRPPASPGMKRPERTTYPPIKPSVKTLADHPLNSTGMESGEQTYEETANGRFNGRPASRSNSTNLSTLDGKISVAFVDEDQDSPREEERKVSSEGGEDNSPTVIFKESWSDKEDRIRSKSPIGHLPGWRLVPVIIKANDDLRQEMFASQLVKQIAMILEAAEIPVYIRPYDIIATSHNAGIIEAIPDTVSLDALKKNDLAFTTLLNFFERHFGWEGSPRFNEARSCFVESLSAYSILCYILNVKDRHNGNILLDSEGHAIHIDFGFMLARTPGNANFESAPFKMTAEWIELMGGPSSNCFKRFRQLCCDTFMALRKHYHKITSLVEMMAHGNEHLPCFGGQPEEVIQAMTNRFRPDLHDRACISYVNHLIDDAMHNWRTTFYDKYQQCFVGIKG